MIEPVSSTFTFYMSKLSQSALPHHWSDWFQCRQFYELGIFLREITSASCSCIWRSKFILLCKRYGKVHHTPLENIPGCLPFFSRPWARRWRTIHKCLDAWPVRSQTNVYIPSRRASLPVGWYQLFCLVTEPHVYVNNLPRVALDSTAAGIWTSDMLLTSPALGHQATPAMAYAAPCGFEGCKNRPAQFRGRMS